MVDKYQKFDKKVFLEYTYYSLIYFITSTNETTYQKSNVQNKII